MRSRYVVRGIGRTLIVSGVLVLAFVAYQLWGTGLAEARAQRDLLSSLEKRLAPPFDSNPPPVPEGEAVAIIKIPELGVEKAVVEGVGVPDLKRGPGHYPTTPMPGQAGNAAIAGHRTTYGAPFNRLDELEVGDLILVTTHQGRFRYELTSLEVVTPSEVSVLAPTSDDRLTLTTCHPKFSARQRLVAVSRLMGPALPASSARSGSLAEAGLSGDPSARGPALAWGLACALVALITWAASRLWRRWPAYVLGTPVFCVALFVFFENFARLLPANI